MIGKMDKTGLIRSRAKGFSLIEILVALALITGLTLMMFQAIAPWLNLRQKIETERRLEQVHDALGMAYRLNAMQIESQSGPVLHVTVGGKTYEVGPSSLLTQGGVRSCEENEEAAAVIAAFMADDANRSFLDGSRQPLCLFITPRIAQPREGVTLYYHVAAIVAMGNDGVLGETTGLSDQGVLTIDPESDDIGVVLNGFNIQYDLYRETRRRVDRVAEVYGAYFTARYLGNPERDYSVDYFVAGAYPYDSGEGAVPLPTEGNWGFVHTHLAGLGLGPDEQVSAYESNNAIEVANQVVVSGTLPFGVQVQEPEPDNPAKMALPPYTALLRARLPGPGGADNYLLRVVPGNY